MKLIKENLNTMLVDRKYKFVEKIDNYLLYSSEKHEKHKVVIFFTLEKVGVEFIKNMITKAEEMEINHIILVSKEKLTAFANKHILQYPIKIEFFLFEELKFNVTTHYLVPQHILLSHEESQEIIDYYGKKNLPQIKQTDILSRYFDADIGQIFRIKRKEGGIYYRLVVN